MAQLAMAPIAPIEPTAPRASKNLMASMNQISFFFPMTLMAAKTPVTATAPKATTDHFTPMAPMALIFLGLQRLSWLQKLLLIPRPQWFP